MRILTDEVKTYKNQMIISEVKNILANINKPMENFIIRLDLDKKRINKWKKNQEKISIKFQSNISYNSGKHKKNMRHRVQSDNINICIIEVIEKEERQQADAIYEEIMAEIFFFNTERHQAIDLRNT